ncbi:MAG: hypothetical protein Q8L34_04015 [Candidatus Woesearchaeota archaeon]|nr:hypothetical protein [Candidatus Woesearchaeota archaeon]
MQNSPRLFSSHVLRAALKSLGILVLLWLGGYLFHGLMSLFVGRNIPVRMVFGKIPMTQNDYLWLFLFWFVFTLFLMKHNSLFSKRVTLPKVKDFERLATFGKKFAAKKGIKEEDVLKDD